MPHTKCAGKLELRLARATPPAAVGSRDRDAHARFLLMVAAKRMSVRRTALRAMTIVVPLLFAARGVSHAAPTEAQLQAARELFKQGEQDEDGTRWTDALDKFKRVAQVRSTAGVRYHIALCEEHLGQLVAALGDYTTAESQARAEGADDVLKSVSPQLAELGPRVPRLTLRVIPDLPDAVVKLDGLALPPGLIGVAIPLDVGVHTVEASAPRRPTAATTVTMHERDTTALDLKLGEPTGAAHAMATAPPAAAAPPPSNASPGAPESPLRPHTSRAPAIIAAGGAVALVGLGVASFVVAGGKHSDAQASCATQISQDACDKSSVRAWDAIALAAWVGGAGAAVLSILLWTHASSTDAASASAAVVFGPGSVGVRGSF
jgi:hypothetical protein